MERQRPICPPSSQVALTGTSDPSQRHHLGHSALSEVDTGEMNISQDPIFSLVGNVEPDFQAQEGLLSDHRSTMKNSLVGELKNGLIVPNEHTKSDPIYSAKLAKYPSYRQVLRDGNSGWRGFSYFDILVRQGNKTHIQEECTRLTSLKNMLIKVGGFHEFLLENMEKETTNLLRELDDLVSTRPRQTAMHLLTRFNEPKISNAIIHYFRLLASSWLKRYSSLYENLIPRTLGIDGYRKNYLEAPNQEIDPLGMTILTDVLIKPAGFTVEIVYLDRIEGSQITSQLIQDKVDNGVPKTPSSSVIHLLCRPDHYDILYQSSSELPLSNHQIYHQSPDLQVSLAHNIVSLAHNIVSSPACQTTMPSLREFCQGDIDILLSIPGAMTPFLKYQEDRFRSSVVAMQIDQSIQKGQEHHESSVLSNWKENISEFPVHDETRPRLSAASPNLQEYHDSQEQEDQRSYGENIPDFAREICSVFTSHSEAHSEIETEYAESDSISGSGHMTPNGDWRNADISSHGVMTEGSLVSPLLESSKQTIVDRIMKEFWKIFQADSALTQSEFRSCTVTGSSSKDASDSGPLGEKRIDNKGKRRQSEEDDQASEDENQGGSKRFCLISSVPENLENRIRFACPYRKNDPQKYCLGSWNICALTGHKTVARVKEHLYRYHRVYQCPRCKDPFKLEKDLQDHSEASQACESKPWKEVAGITNQIEKLLHSRKKAYRGQTEKGRWEEIYKILFPLDNVPSPYFEPIEEHQYGKNNSPNAQYLDDYETYVRRELPRSFRNDLETAVNDEVGLIEERLMDRIMDMYQTCQERVLNTYRSNQATNSHPEASHASASSSDAKVFQIEERAFQEEQYLDSSNIETTLFADIEDLSGNRAPCQPSTDFIASSVSQTPEVLNQTTVCDRCALTEYLDPVYHQENEPYPLPLYPSRSFHNKLSSGSNGEGSKIFTTEDLLQSSLSAVNSTMSAESRKFNEDTAPLSANLSPSTPILFNGPDEAGPLFATQGISDWEGFLNIETSADEAC